MSLNIDGIDFEKRLNDDGELAINEHGMCHLFEKQDLLAVWAAYTAGRPLLLRGKPGMGKSQLAKAIAQQLNWAFVSETLHGGKELEELHWHYDAINRLGEAQSLAYQAAVWNNDDIKQKVDQALAHSNYIRPGAFWWAFNWASAAKTLPDNPEAQALKPHSPPDWDEKQGGVVLLLDEIDKAEPDLPNGLLQTLGDLEFTVPYSNSRIRGNAPRLLVVITTNEERELPAALVRRCYTHTLKMDDKPATRLQWLEKRGRLHFGSKVDDAVYSRAAELLWEDRQTHKRYPPGLAEYLDLLRPLSQMSKDTQKERLEAICGFVYQKEAERD